MPGIYSKRKPYRKRWGFFLHDGSDLELFEDGQEGAFYDRKVENHKGLGSEASRDVLALKNSAR